MLDPPPVDALQKALESAILLGFIAPAPGGHALTPRGEVAGRFQSTSMAEASILLSADVWGAAARDLLTVAALGGMSRVDISKNIYASRREAPLYDPATMRQGATHDTPGAFQDDFLEGLDLFDGVVAALGAGFSKLVAFADLGGFQLAGLAMLAGRRDKLAEEAAAAGVDILANDELRVSRASSVEERRARVGVLRRCLAAAYPASVVRRDGPDAPFRFMGMPIRVQGAPAGARVLLTNQPVLVKAPPGKAKAGRFEYVMRASLICPLDDTPTDTELLCPRRGDSDSAAAPAPAAAPAAAAAPADRLASYLAVLRARA